MATCTYFVSCDLFLFQTATLSCIVQAAFLVMGHVGGKLLLFQAGLPTLGPGKLKPSRDNLNLYNTDRESSLRNPEDLFFKRYAGEASSRQITLDVFLGTNGFADLASLASIPRYTCGQVRVQQSSSDSAESCMRSIGMQVARRCVLAQGCR